MLYIFVSIYVFMTFKHMFSLNKKKKKKKWGLRGSKLHRYDFVMCFKQTKSTNVFSHYSIKDICYRYPLAMTPDKRGYPENNFLFSPGKHMLWISIRSASQRGF